MYRAGYYTWYNTLPSLLEEGSMGVLYSVQYWPLPSPRSPGIDWAQGMILYRVEYQVYSLCRRPPCPFHF
jgi:hypothetical protein